MSVSNRRFSSAGVLAAGLVATLFAVVVFPLALRSASPEDEVRGLVAELTESWNSGDAHRYSAHFAENGEFTNIRGARFYGKKAFEERHAQIFSTVYKGSHLGQKIDRIQFVRQDIAVVDVDIELQGFVALPPGIQAGPDGVLRTELLLVLAKEGKDWMIVAYHNVATAPAKP